MYYSRSKETSICKHYLIRKHELAYFTITLNNNDNIL